MLVAQGDIANGNVVAPGRLGRLFRVVPIAVKAIGTAGKKLARLAVRHLVALFVQQFDGRGTDDLPTDRAQVVELLVGVKHRRPSAFSRAVKLEQAGVGKHSHDLTLGFRQGGRRGDHQLFDPAVICALWFSRMGFQQHGVVSRHQGGEGCAALSKCP